MNYYPFYSGVPYMTAANLAKPSLLGGITGGFKWSSLLSGAQKTLNVVNQAIPLIQQARPMINNAKTMFKVMNEFKKVETPVEAKTNSVNNVTNSSKTNVETTSQSNIAASNTGLTFFQ